jgi:cephalosporin-C deacetylase-like acetyl esterase
MKTGEPAISVWGTPQEDWANLAADRSLLKPRLNGVLLSKEERQSYTLELVRVQWRIVDPIDLTIVIPRGVQKPRAVLYLYGYPGNTERFMDDNWCRAATRDGMAAVGFVSALTGERFRARPMREWFVRELQESMGSSVHDVQLIIDYLARRGDLSIDQGVGMFGQGSGGAIAIMAAAVDPRIHAVDALNPWGDWPDWLKSSPIVPDDQRAEFQATEFLRKVAAVEPIDYVPALKGRAFRVQQVMDYPNTPPAARDKIASAVPADALVQYKDRTEQARAWEAAGFSGWLAKQLEPGVGRAAK